MAVNTFLLAKDPKGFGNLWGLFILDVFWTPHPYNDNQQFTKVGKNSDFWGFFKMFRDLLVIHR